MDAKDLQFKDNGLLPAVIQHFQTNEVLMVGYMNPGSAQKTLETGTVWFWSRSRTELWHKGDTSGNFFYVKEMYTDCDQDVVLVKVDPVGPACHTGAASCFFERLPAIAGARPAVPR
ncbi:MAG: phosphoribosyl-AMP cyclohydrolase [Dehalococcoidia bacterium]